MPQFYTYLWLRENRTPYYVGKGYGKRAFVHQKPPYPPKNKSRILVLHRDSEQDALTTEIELIRNWGRKDIGTGCLHNRTDGGEGHAGYIPTPEHRAKVSLKSKGNKSFLGHKHPPEWSAKMSANQTGDNRPYRLGIPHTEETKLRISKSLEGNQHRKGMPHSKETKEKLSKANKGKKRSLDSREHLKASWTPERRARRSEETRRRMEDRFIKTIAWG